MKAFQVWLALADSAVATVINLPYMYIFLNVL